MGTYDGCGEGAGNGAFVGLLVGMYDGCGDGGKTGDAVGRDVGMYVGTLLVGTLVGVLPGIGPLTGISILLPVTFGLDATKAVVMLSGIYYGSQYGGSTTSILMRIPGEASSVMTCLDGYAMARRGRAGAALCIAAVGSFIAGTFALLMLTVIAPPLG